MGRFDNTTKAQANRAKDKEPQEHVKRLEAELAEAQEA
jgi:hypothetical protein